jgi:TetR/AcrR family transcriptional repressor of bet genes
VTVAQIARRAGVSSALAHHYFGSKEAIFVAAMRHVLTLYGAEVRGALATARTPRDRVEAIVRASFSTGSFRRESVAAWLNFYVMAQTMPEARRLLLSITGGCGRTSSMGCGPWWRDRAGLGGRGAGRADRRGLPAAGACRARARPHAATTLVLDHLAREIGD